MNTYTAFFYDGLLPLSLIFSRRTHGEICPEEVSSQTHTLKLNEENDQVLIMYHYVQTITHEILTSEGTCKKRRNGDGCELI